MTGKAKRSLIIAVLLVILLISVSSSLYWRYGSEISDGWGRGEIKVSEWAYYMSRMDRIIRQWRQTKREAQHDKDGRTDTSYNVYLVIDTKQPAIWIEKDGQLQHESHSELTRSMRWNLYYSGPEGKREIGDRIRLKVRGRYSSRIFPEMIYLAGEGQGKHLSFDFNSKSHGRSSGSGRFIFKPYKNQRKRKDDGKDYYLSIVVPDAEYEQYMASLVHTPPDQTSGQIKVEQSPLNENRSNWSKVRKRLYQHIDAEVMREGLDLTRLQVEIGPDYTAGNAEIRANRGSFIEKIFRPGPQDESYLKFDHLGADVWYVKSAPHPDQPMIRPRRLDFEFLVSATDEILDTERQTWLDKGRAKQPFMTRPESKWQVTLSNGVKIEFIGICENPSAGREWWGPDGSALDYVPYANWEAYGRSRDDRRIYEMIWKIKSPGNGGSGSTSSFEGSQGSYSRRTLDRYGNDLHNMNVDGYGFEKTREKTTWKTGFKVGSGDYEWVRFKNISLVRGKNFGFEILRGEE